MFKFEYNMPASLFLEEAADLLHTHWKELAVNQDKIFLKPNVDAYVTYQNMGLLNNIVVRNQEDKIVGYSVLMIQPHIHYCDSIYASVDVIYVDPNYRNGSLGARLLFETEKLAVDKGADVIVHHAKPNVPMIIKPLEKLGYSLYEHIYGKYLGEK